MTDSSRQRELVRVTDEQTTARLEATLEMLRDDERVVSAGADVVAKRSINSYVENRCGTRGK
ncbi:hypothetical protein HJC23_003031 [Cyclotella cryptica]|uniref:Uncharacterized protein n=1 Tax=Cyclotella cryptica TaxID=29204 RepID=A0ABD3PYI5_9STRA